MSSGISSPPTGAGHEDDVPPTRTLRSRTASTPLSRERIIRAALALLDREGADALSMRRLADELGCPPMSLYGHIAGKADVLDGVYELILSEVTLPSEDLPWQEWVRAGWSEYRRALLEHPSAVGAVVARRPMREGSFTATIEAALRVLTSAGLTIEEAFDVQRLLGWLTVGSVVNEIRYIQQRDGPREPTSVAIPPGKFPLFMQALPHMLPPDFSRSYQFGLELVIGAVERLAGASDAPSTPTEPPGGSR